MIINGPVVIDGDGLVERDGSADRDGGGGRGPRNGCMHSHGRAEGKKERRLNQMPASCRRKE